MAETITQVVTPAALVDLDRVEANCQRMAERMTRLAVHLRPHVKTHKCLEAARLQVQGHFGGITVSTMAEAYFFADGGFTDITLAVPIAPLRIEEALGLGARIDRLNVLVDDLGVAQQVATAAEGKGRVQPVFLKVDCGYGRAGVDPHGDAGVALGRFLHEHPHLDFRGILAHGGHSYDCDGVEAIKVVAEEERSVTVAFAERLRRAGIEVPEVSIGSTPTMAVAEDLTGITEVRPGNYAFFDLFQASIGSCRVEDAAFSILASVIGVYPERGQVLIDAGAIAISKDPGAIHISHEQGFGLVYAADGLVPMAHLKLNSLSQEHGKLKIVGDGALPVVGDRLRILPNHSCLAAAPHAQYIVARGSEVVDEWTPAKGW